MLKIQKYLCLTTLGLFLYTQPSTAEIDSSAIVQNFIQAIQSKDKDKITIAFNELVTNFDAQKLLQKDWPDHFTLFNFYKISERIKDTKSSYGDVESTNTVEPDTTSANTAKGLPSNRDYINIKNTPNRIAVRQSSPTSNIDAVRQFSNQDQVSNQEQIRRRR